MSHEAYFALISEDNPFPYPSVGYFRLEDGRKKFITLYCDPNVEPSVSSANFLEIERDRLTRRPMPISTDNYNRLQQEIGIPPKQDFYPYEHILHIPSKKTLLIASQSSDDGHWRLSFKPEEPFYAEPTFSGTFPEIEKKLDTLGVPPSGPEIKYRPSAQSQLMQPGVAIRINNHNKPSH